MNCNWRLRSEIKDGLKATSLGMEYVQWCAHISLYDTILCISLSFQPEFQLGQVGSLKQTIYGLSSYNTEIGKHYTQGLFIPGI